MFFILFFHVFHFERGDISWPQKSHGPVMSGIYIKKYCNQKQIILAIKNKLLFQSNKYSAGKEVGKERRKEGRKEGREGGRKEGRKKGSKEASKQASKQGRKEGRNEAESGISGHLLKVALQLYLFDLTYILYAHSRHVVHYICIYIYIYWFIPWVLYIYIFIYLYLEYYIYIYIYLNPECHIQPTAAHGTGIVILPWGEAPRPLFLFWTEPYQVIA